MNLFSDIEHQVGNPEALSGTVRVGVAEMVAITWLVDFVSTLHKGLPNLNLEFDVNLTADLLTKLNDGELDIALIPGARLEGDIAAKSLGRVAFAWMASPALALPKR